MKIDVIEVFSGTLPYTAKRLEKLTEALQMRYFEMAKEFYSDSEIRIQIEISNHPEKYFKQEKITVEIVASEDERKGENFIPENKFLELAKIEGNKIWQAFSKKVRTRRKAPVSQRSIQ